MAPIVSLIFLFSQPEDPISLPAPAYIILQPFAKDPPLDVACAQRDGRGSVPITTAPVDTVTMQTWSGCQGNAEVILYTLADHGHSWPGSKVMPKVMTSPVINATDVIWDFFKVHTLS